MKNIRYIAIVLMLIFTSLLGSQITAHSPENIDLTYNNSTNILTAIITHNTENSNTHYVAKVDVYRNDIEILDNDYTSQPVMDTFTLTFFIEAVPGDVLKVEAKDNLDFKTQEQIIVPNGNNNNPPNIPNINGQTNGVTGTEYEYSFISTDPDGDSIFYCIQWGDNSGEICLGPFQSGIKQTTTHTWNEDGKYIVKVKARDTNNDESDWATLEVNMPKTKEVNIPLFLQRLLQHFPFFEKILNQIIL